MDSKLFFEKNGYLVLKNLINKNSIDLYRNYWTDHHAINYDGTVKSLKNKMGWQESSPYIEHKIILEILCSDEIYSAFSDLGLECMGLHLSFTPWYSTEKIWHQDYTNGDRDSAKNYVGVWVALSDIDIEAGPFAFIPGSNNWDIDFSIYSRFGGEDIIKYMQKKISSENASPQIFLAQKGDIIIWQGHTIHCGLKPVNTNKTRECLIGHYVSGLNGKGKNQIDYFKKFKNGFYVDHNNQLNNLYN